jgi:hypothetical protein
LLSPSPVADPPRWALSFVRGLSVAGKSPDHITRRPHRGMVGRPNRARHRLWDHRRSPHWNRWRLHRQLAAASTRHSSWLGDCCSDHQRHDRRAGPAVDHPPQRIMLVAAIQQHLHGSKPGATIALGPYLKLCETLAASMIGGSRPISLRVNAEGGTASSSQAVSIGRAAAAQLPIFLIVSGILGLGLVR